MSATRRLFLGRSLGAAASAALPASLLAPEAALAQSTDESDALERLAELEQASELAYSLASEDAELKPDTAEVIERYATQSAEHATALEEALDQLAVDPPESSDDPADYEALADFDPQADERDLLDFVIGLELDLIAAYEEETTNLEAADLARTAAQVGANHAQHVVELRLLAGEEPTRLTDLGEPVSSAGTSEPTDSTSSGAGE